MSAARLLVTGKVQGVWFRASTREQALRLHLQGFARNRDDGGVEVVACGDDASLALLEAWLWQGPPAARVSDVSRETLPTPPSVVGFSTL